ncbi:plexin-B2-like [Lytechinus pictus]|uniref:plexin-B2-like n=1 Tax=Lytechinus pictus TaxID=7653 RepID=UPI0030B9CF22
MIQRVLGEFLLLILISCQIGSIQTAPLSSYLVSYFTPPGPDSNLPFNHIAINNITGDFYIGARERLYQLDSDLNLKQTVDTGKCSGKNEDNINNLLVVVITPQHYKLISCGGCGDICRQNSLDNISVDLEPLPDAEGVVAVGDLPSVGAVAFGTDYESNADVRLDESFFLFNGVSGTGIPGEISFISKRSVDNLVVRQQISGNHLESQNSFAFKHLIPYKDYLYYFISRVEKTYLGRICRDSPDGENFASYTEIKLKCGHDESQNDIQSAFIGTAGTQLAESMNINTTDDLLYAVFSSDSSSLCVYKMIDVQQNFEDAILGCIEETSTGAENIFLKDSICKGVSHFHLMAMNDCLTYLYNQNKCVIE